MAPGFAFQKEPRTVGFGHQGTWLSGDKFGNGQIWAEGGRPVGFPLQHLGDLEVLAIRGKDGLIASGGHDGIVQLWDRSGRPFGSPLRQSFWVRALAFSPDGKQIAAGCVDNTTRLFETQTGRQIGPPLTHPGNVSSSGISAVFFHPIAKIAISVSHDGTVGRMSTETGRQISDLWQYPQRISTKGLKPRMPHQFITRAAISGDGRMLMIAAGGSIHLSDAATAQTCLHLSVEASSHAHSCPMASRS